MPLLVSTKQNKGQRHVEQSKMREMPARMPMDTPSPVYKDENGDLIWFAIGLAVASGVVMLSHMQ